MDEEKNGSPGETAVEQTESVTDGMDVKTEEPETCMMKFSITIPEATIDREIEKKIKDVVKNAQIKGFRKGKVPRQLIEKRFGGDILEELKSDILSESLEKVMEENKLRERAVGDPTFHPEPENMEVIKGKPFEYTAEFEIKPAFELPKYRGIEVPKVDTAVTDEDVEAEIKNFLQSQGSFEPVEDRSLEPEDHGIVSATVIAGGEETFTREGLYIAPDADAIFGMKAERLHASLEGLNIGEESTVTVTFTEDPPDALKIPEAERGKEGQIKMKLAEIKQMKPAEMSPELLKRFDIDDENEFRVRIRTNLEQKKTYMAEEQMNENIVNKLLEATNVDVPPNLAKRLAANAAMRQAYQRRMMGEAEGDVAKDIGDMMKDAAKPAEDSIRRRFLLEAIADKEKIFTLDDDVSARIAELAAARSVPPDEIEADLRKNNEMESLRATVREEKVLTFLQKHAKQTDAPAEEKEEEKPDENAGEK
ncbi:MAG: trigger factor [Planctomycetota bacterium]|jgi:trigger factor